MALKLNLLVLKRFNFGPFLVIFVKGESMGMGTISYVLDIAN